MTSQQRIFGEIFKIAPAQRIAFDIDAWPQHHIDLVVARLLGNGAAHGFEQTRVPAAGTGASGGKGRGHRRLIEAEMVAGLGLKAQAMRAIAQPDAGNAGATFGGPKLVA